jgi:hypothetical protein
MMKLSIIKNLKFNLLMMINKLLINTYSFKNIIILTYEDYLSNMY